MVRRVRKRQQDLFVNRKRKVKKAHGGKRKNAGRRVTPGRSRASEAHRRRERFGRATPVHVVLRTHPDVGALRSDRKLWAIREALIALATRVEEFRVVHISVQRTHVHLIVEAKDNEALSRGMQAFAISAAKHLNASLVVGGVRRRGTVFPDRYHATRLGSPRQVRNTIAYVLNNWRHHGEHRRVSWALDKYASALGFDGWRDGAFIQPPGYVKPMVWEPETWLLRVGWRRRGLIAIDEVPGLSE